jgi:hypothetical protein
VALELRCTHTDTRERIHQLLFYVVPVLACNLKAALVDTIYRLVEGYGMMGMGGNVAVCVR